MNIMVSATTVKNGKIVDWYSSGLTVETLYVKLSNRGKFNYDRMVTYGPTGDSEFFVDTGHTNRTKIWE
jgi:hypothetical protein